MLLLLVAVVLAVGCGGSVYLLHQQAVVESRNRSLDVARTLAEDDAVRAAVTAASDAPPAGAATLRDGLVQREAEAVRARTGALFVVVTDDRGLRLAHPNPDVLGQRVSTDPTRALAGEEVVTDETGTLGASARAKVPVRALGSDRVVGEVSVGVGSAAIADRARDALVPALAVAAAALVLGLAGASVLAGRLRRLTLGLQPEELGGILQAHDAVLHGIAEGVVSLGPDQRVVLANGEAARLLGRPVPAGAALDDLPPAVREVVTSPPAAPVLAVVGDRALLLSARRVDRDGRLLGHVVTVADRTDVELLTRQLDAVQAVGEVLRAQRHEFANRLHLVAGLLETGRPEEAGAYVRTLLATGPLGSRVEGLDAVGDPYLQAFVAAKAAHARERQVVLALGEVSVAGSRRRPGRRHHGAGQPGGQRRQRRRGQSRRPGRGGPRAGGRGPRRGRRRLRGRSSGSTARQRVRDGGQHPRRGGPRHRPRPGAAGGPRPGRRRVAGSRIGRVRRRLRRAAPRALTPVHQLEVT